MNPEELKQTLDINEPYRQLILNDLSRAERYEKEFKDSSDCIEHYLFWKKRIWKLERFRQGLHDYLDSNNPNLKTEATE